jgi:heme-degrading monooxygenase HmoA
MFARVSTYTVPADGAGEAVQSFRAAVEQILGLDGLAGAYFLVAREGEKAITLTLWDTAEAMETSRVRASRARSDAARAADASVESVEEFEVAIAERPR